MLGPEKKLVLTLGATTIVVSETEPTSTEVIQCLYYLCNIVATEAGNYRADVTYVMIATF